MNLNGKTILLTGGTGSFGKKFCEYVFKNYKVKKLIIFSRDEYKHYQMNKIFPQNKYPIRFFLGDIRDKDRLYRAFEGVDIIVHAAALKHVPICEYNPFEAVKTNIIGAQNIVEVAIDKGVKKVVALSTDKAVSPINLYGATKLVMEKIFISGNVYVGDKETNFSVVRYGNVIGSRGSVIPFFISLLRQGANELPITDKRMTRFWISLEEGIKLVIHAIETSVGGEIFVPKIPSCRIVDLAQALVEMFAKEEKVRFKEIGIRPGEKLHETLINEEESRNTLEDKDKFVILPYNEFINREKYKVYKNLKKVKEGFIYRSDLNKPYLTKEEIKNKIKSLLSEIDFVNYF